MQEVSIDDFARLDLRIARVVAAEPHPNADRLMVLRVEIAAGEERQIVAGIRNAYSPEDLVGRKIVVVANLAPAMLRGIESQGMLLAATDPDGKARLLAPDTDVPVGARVK